MAMTMYKSVNDVEYFLNLQYDHCLKCVDINKNDKFEFQKNILYTFYSEFYADSDL